MRFLQVTAIVALVVLGSNWTALQAAPPVSSGESSQPVALSVAVPADAEIWLEGFKTTSTGTLRQFLTPALKPGQDYILNVRVKFRRNNKETDESRALRVRAGDNLKLDYTGGEGERMFYFTPDAEPSRPAPSYVRPIEPSYYTPRYRPPPYGINPPAGGPGTTW